MLHKPTPDTGLVVEQPLDIGLVIKPPLDTGLVVEQPLDTGLVIKPPLDTGLVMSPCRLLVGTPPAGGGSGVGSSCPKQVAGRELSLGEISSEAWELSHNAATTSR